MLYAGLDLSRKRLDVCLLTEEGEIVGEFGVPPDPDGLRGLIKRVGAVTFCASAILTSQPSCSRRSCTNRAPVIDSITPSTGDGAAVDDEGGLASERGGVGSQHQRPDRLLILSVVWSALARSRRSTSPPDGPGDRATPAPDLAALP